MGPILQYLLNFISNDSTIRKIKLPLEAEINAKRTRETSFTKKKCNLL